MRQRNRVNESTCSFIFQIRYTVHSKLSLNSDKLLQGHEEAVLSNTDSGTKRLDLISTTEWHNDCALVNNDNDCDLDTKPWKMNTTRAILYTSHDDVSVLLILTGDQTNSLCWDVSSLPSLYVPCKMWQSSEL